MVCLGFLCLDGRHPCIPHVDAHVRSLLAAVTLSKLELLYNVVSLGYDAVWMDTDVVSPSDCALQHCPCPAACQAGSLAHGTLIWACIKPCLHRAAHIAAKGRLVLDNHS